MPNGFTIRRKPEGGVDYSIAPELRHLFADAGEAPVPITQIARQYGGPNRPLVRGGYPEFGLWEGVMPIMYLGANTTICTVYQPNVAGPLPADAIQAIEEKAKNLRFNEARYRLLGIAAAGQAVVLHYGPSSYAEQSALMGIYYGQRDSGRSLDELLRYHPGQTGTNVLAITADNELVLGECPPKPFLPPCSVGVVAEALSRQKDCKSDGGAPDLAHCARRGLREELGIPADAIRQLVPVAIGTTRAGISDTLWVAYTQLTAGEIRELHQEAPDKDEHARLHMVPLNPDAVAEFAMSPNEAGQYPILTSPAAALLHALLRREFGEEVTRAAIESRMTPSFMSGTQQQIEAWNRARTKVS